MALGALLVFGATPALAALTRNYQSQLTGFAAARQVAFDASGNVWVADKGNAVVDEFNGSGTQIAQLTGTPSGPFGAPFGVAVDHTTGDIYVADDGNSVVDVFDSSGTYLSQLTGTPSGSFSGLRHLAVDQASGDLYVTEAFNNAVDVFTRSTATPGTFVRQLTGTPSGAFSFPASVAVDQVTGDVYVAELQRDVVDKFDSSGTFLSQLTGTPSGAFAGTWGVGTDASGDLFVSDGTGAVDEFDSSGTFLLQLTGTPSGPFLGPIDAAADAGNDLYLVDGGTSAQVVDIFGPTVTLPDVTTNPASDVGPSGATVTGTVNPDGVDASCQVEYGTDTSYGQSVPCSPADVGSGSSPVAVTATLSGLQPLTTYHFRIDATNVNGTTHGVDKQFTTPAAPSVDAESASSIASMSAELEAQVNPDAADTTFHFEYGTTTAYGSAAPVPDGDLGAGTTDQAASVFVTGLQPLTTYHYRVVASNAFGTTDGADQTFTTTGTPTAGLPDGRAYELVSPPSTDGALIGNVFLTAILPDLASDGARVIVQSIQCFADAGSCHAEGNGEGSPYEFTRTSTGWVTTALAPSATQYPSNRVWLVSADSGTALFGASTPPGGEDDLYARAADGTFTQLGPVTPPADGPQGSPPAGGAASEEAATADFSHVVYDGHQFWPFDPASGGSTYEYVGPCGDPSACAAAQPQLVGVSGGPGSTSVISACGDLLGQSTNVAVTQALSADGQTVYFTANACSGGSGANAGTPVPAQELYARIDGALPDAHTVAISQRSPSDCTGACQSSPPADAAFQGASADGSKAYFTSTQQLTDQASEDSQSGDTATYPGCLTTTGTGGCNLYLYDFSKPAGHELSTVSAGDTSGGGPRVRGVVAISGDGSHVYFVAQGVLTTTPNAQGQSPTDGADNLYVHDAGTGDTAFIATLPGSDVGRGLWGASDLILPNVSPDGRFLVFESAGRLTPDDTSQSGAAQVFRYDAQTGALSRVSVGDQGFNDDGNRSAPTPCVSTGCSEDAHIVPEMTFRAGAARTDPTMSDDGSRVFFQSPVGLTAHALDDVQIGTNGDGTPQYAQNVYEWEQAGVGSCPAGRASGCVYLISDGRDTGAGVNYLCGQFGVCLLGTDSTGQNVFFTTADQLVPQDTDNGVPSVYDARVGGGFPFTPATACSGDGCQGTPSTAPPAPTAASVTFTGPGDATPGAAPAKVRVLSRVVHGSTFFVRVRVPGRGRIAISGAGIRTVRRSVSKADVYRLRVRLTARERRLLARRRSLRLTLRIAYTPPGGRTSAASFSITVKPAIRQKHAKRTRRAATTTRRAGR